ncbi:hypothetical protein ACP3TJ_11745 [Desulforudis sp. 1088]
MQVTKTKSQKALSRLTLIKIPPNNKEACSPIDVQALNKLTGNWLA